LTLRRGRCINDHVTRPRRLRLTLVALVSLGVAGVAGATPQRLDPSFGDGGKVVTDFRHQEDVAQALAVQPDGKIVAAGRSWQGFALARYERDGTLDREFGRRGRVRTSFRDGAEAFDVALQPDGKIVVAGIGDGDFALARYDRHGRLDPAFDGDGKVVTDFGGTDGARGVAVQRDGLIVAVGATEADGGDDVAVARYLPDGRLDPSFGAGGKVVTSLSVEDYGEAVALQPDGKIVVAGYAGPDYGGSDFVLVRYRRDGRLDDGFGIGGKVFTQFRYGPSYAFAVALQPDGRIVAAGYAWILGRRVPRLLSHVEFALARYRPGGRLDATFGEGGMVLTTIGADSVGESLSIEPDGRIVVAGWASPYPYDFALARYLPDGRAQGTERTDFGSSTWDQARDAALQENGRVVVAGLSGGDFALARYRWR
jgi:uncharacterized delta-60 repeat protein